MRKTKPQILTPAQLRQKDLERLKAMRLIDDTYARVFFRKNRSLAEYALRIITSFDDLFIDPTDYETQFDMKRLAGARSLILDVKAGDTKGRKYDFEVEKWDASPERAETHVAGMITEHLHEGDKFSDLPEIYIIFLTNHDVIGNGRAINKFSYRNDDDIDDETAKKEPHASMNGVTHIFFVNGDYEDETSDIGKLIHDFKCVNADEMLLSDFADATKWIKQTEEGEEEMCAIMEELREESEEQAALKIALNMIQRGKNTHEEIAEDTGLPLETVKALAGEKAS